MKNPLSAFARAKRRARRKGKSHGRQGLPNLEWTGGPVPYLESVHAEYGQQVEVLDQKLRIIEGQSITSKEEDVADKQSQEYQIGQLDQERSMYEAQLVHLLGLRTGEDNENPTGKAARQRHVPIWLYVIALISLGIGEFFVTLPAVEIILGDEFLNALVVTASFSALSILASHLIGLTFKIAIDRSEPQPISQRWGAIAIITGIMLVVLFLSAARSKKVGSVPVTFGMSNNVFGTVMFFVIQMTFIICAIGLSYYNHSEVESAISSTKRRIKRITGKIRSLTRARLIPDRGNLTPEKRVVQNKAIVTNMRLLEAEYREICGIYRGANMLSQKVSFTEPGPGLIEKPLEIPSDRIEAEV